MANINPILLSYARAGTPTVSSFSQSSNYGGAGVAVATITNMADNITEPFMASVAGVGQWIKATLAAPSYVTSVTIGAPTSTGGWSSNYINGCILQISDDNVLWRDVAIMSGYITAGVSYNVNSLKTWPVNLNCSYIRLVSTQASLIYVTCGEFVVV
jgi:hypothetical protein